MVFLMHNCRPAALPISENAIFEDKIYTDVYLALGIICRVTMVKQENFAGVIIIFEGSK